MELEGRLAAEREAARNNQKKFEFGDEFMKMEVPVGDKKLEADAVALLDKMAKTRPQRIEECDNYIPEKDPNKRYRMASFNPKPIPKEIVRD